MKNTFAANRFKLGSFFIGALIILMHAGCASNAKPGLSQLPLEESNRQYACRSKIYFSDVSAAQTVSMHAGRADANVPIGEKVQRQINKRFWVDSAVKIQGRAQPTVTAGFAPGTFAKEKMFGSDADVQVMLQVQIMEPMGRAHYEVVGGRSVADTADLAAEHAISQLMDNFSALLVSANFCRDI
ncbi:MAG TPA: hypothetical protein PK031_05680 [Pseudomonadales bacterium]|nr:hypothetical protein [Pseudomonadales bacterium]